MSAAGARPEGTGRASKGGRAMTRVDAPESGARTRAPRATRRALGRLMGAAALGAGLLALPGCGGGDLRQSMGLVTPPPDEFLVVARRPLEMPPDLAALPPPQAGAPSRVEPNPALDAQAALGLSPRAASEVPAAASRSEAALLAAAGAEAADGDIRERLGAEAPAPERRFGLDTLFGIPIVQDPQAEAERLDPAAEARRLREAGLPAPLPPEQPVLP